MVAFVMPKLGRSSLPFPCFPFPAVLVLVEDRTPHCTIYVLRGRSLLELILAQLHGCVDARLQLISLWVKVANLLAQCMA